MTPYKIRFTKEAEKFLQKRTLKERLKLVREIEKLPYHHQVKKMQGEVDIYRLRVGDYRVIYKRQDGELVILVLEIGNRGDVYK